MSQQSLPSNAEQLLSLALRHGAEDAEVYWTQSLSQPVIYEANRLKQVERVESEGLALRLWRQGRCGLVVACGPADLTLLVERAIAISELSAPQPSYLTSHSPSPWDIPPLSLDVETVLTWGNEGMDRLRERHPEGLCNGEWSLDYSSMGLLNSKGCQCQFSDQTVAGYLGVEWVRGDDFFEVDVGQLYSPRFSHSDTPQVTERDDPPLEPMFGGEGWLNRWLAAISRRRDWGERTVDIPSGRYPVIVLPAAIDILLDTVVAALNGRLWVQKASPWEGRVGDRLLSPLLSLGQRPRQGPYGSPFDDEGTPTQAVDWIVAGELQMPFGDRRFAHELQLSPAGNGFRGGLNSGPTPAMFNAVLPKPILSFPEMLKQLGTGLIVERVMGNYGDLAGDFSVSVELGYWVEGGEVIGRVKDVMVAGNAYTALNHLIALGQEPDGLEIDAVEAPDGREWVGSYLAPALMVDGLSTVAHPD